MRGVTRLVREDDGFSLIELLVSMTIGTMVLGAMSLVFIRTTAATTETQNRIETTQTARVAIERMVSLLDSQTCLLKDDGTSTGNVVATPPIVSGDGDSVTFYADLSPSASSVSPDKYMLKYDASRKAITESRWIAKGTEPSVTYDTAASTTKTLVTNVTYARNPATDAQLAMFSYFTFPVSSVATDPVAVAAPLSTTSVKTITQVAIQMQPVARLTGTETAKRASTVSGQSYLQTADPDSKTVCP